MNGPHEQPGRRGLAGRVVEAVVAPIVGPIVGAVDVDSVVDRLDVEGVVERIDLDAVVARVDVDALVRRIDVDAAVGRVDLDALAARIDLDAVLDRVDPNQLLDRVDPDRLLDRVGVDRLLDRVDPNRLLDRVDPDRLLDRVDPDRLLERIDVARLMERVDVDALVARVDVNEVVRRTELGSVIARSTTGVFGELLDAARAVVVTLDLVVQAAVRKVVRPGHEVRPGRPGAPDDVVDVRSMSAGERGVALQGHHAGSLSRFLAFLVDQALIGVLFAAGQALMSAVLDVVLGVTWDPGLHRWFVVVSWALWSFAYMAGQLAAMGRTIGMAIVGLQVVQDDGSRLRPVPAVLRTLVFPLSFLLFGVGFLIGLVRRDRRELHDLIAGTAVVYAWDAELARLRESAPLPATPLAQPAVE